MAYQTGFGDTRVVGIGLGTGLSAIPPLRRLNGQARVGPKGSTRLKEHGANVAY